MTAAHRKSLLAALAALLPLGTAAKPFYVTVPRSYGTRESPILEVAFERRGPVELRVLRPRDLEAFLASQVNLRRAYDPPQAKLNPGRYLSRGLNAARGPGAFLYYALGEEFRRQLAPSLPPRPPRPKKDLARLGEGPERLVGVPAGMEVVRRQWLNLDLGGKDRGFNVPGFEQWGWRGGVEERRVGLAPLPSGLYVVQLVQGRVEGQVTLLVSDLRVQVKQTDGEVLVRVAGADLSPRAGAQVMVRSASGRGPTGRTDKQGEARLSTREPRLLVTVSDGGDVAVVDTDFYSTLAVAPDVFVYTDRPIYRPGDQVRFRGLVRKPDAFLSRLFAPREREVKIGLETQEGKRVEARAAVDSFGAFNGTLALPAEAGTGVFRLVAAVDGEPHQSEARVQDYVKPTFYVEVLPREETIRPGETLRARLRARRYAGGPPAGARYEVYLYRALLETPAWVDDAGLGGQGSAVTYGSVSTTEGRLSVPERLHSTLALREAARGWLEDPWASAAELDSNGEAEIAVPVPPLAPGDERLPWRYTLSARVRDDQGIFATGAKGLFLSPSEVMASVRPGQVVALAGARASLAVRATTLSGRPTGGLEGTVAFALRRADGAEKALSQQSVRTDADGVWRGTMPTPSAGTVVARVTLADRSGRPATGEGSMVVVGTSGEESVRVPALALASRAEPLAPGETAELVALLPAGWGPGGRERGRLWLTLSGSGLFETRLVEASGFSHVLRFPVERRFGSAVYASVAYPTAGGRWDERTVPFRLVQPERLLSVALAPSRSEATPLGPQSIDLRVTDHRGRGVVAQVSVGVVDKAIYALQGELRPRVIDFFYPLGRDNVSTFTSAEFQGYGYGEALARAFHRPGHAFAAVKPPTRPRDVDTAYWNPAVVTDGDGRATVRFTLPVNPTEWTITAVAADAAGRFGEGTAEFASRADLSVVASLPQFLREGDEARGSVRVAETAGKKPPALEVALAATGSVSGGARQAVELAARGERTVPVDLKAPSPGPGQVSLRVTGADGPLADRRELPVRPASVDESVAVSSFGGGRLKLAVPAGASVEEIELSLRPTSVALAMANLEELLTYPYGCLEQLVATTIPNVALYRTLEKAGALDRLDPQAASLLGEARSRAVQGVQRILELAVKGGGFVWFPGAGAPSVPLTLIALDGLAHAAEAGLVDRGDPRLAESAAWLAAQDGLPPPLDATRAWVLARLEGARAAGRVRALLERLPADDLYPVAMAALAADRSGVAAEPAVRERIRVLVARAREALARPAVLEFREAYFAYPLRRAGLTAVIAHAASLGEVDVAVARRRLAEALGDGSGLSTFERSTALLHSLWLVERDARALRAAPPPRVEVEGGGPARLEPRGAGFAARLDRSARAVRVAEFEGQAVLRARLRLPADAVRARAEGMSVARSYWILRPEGRQRLEPGTPVAQGAEVFVELRLDAHDDDRRRSLRSAYYVLEDPVPAGFVPLVEDKEWRAPPLALPLAHESMKRRSLSPERALFFFEEPAWWSRSPRVVGYVLRAQFPGRFTAPPATVEDMYAPQIRGRSEPATLSVKPSDASR